MALPSLYLADLNRPERTALAFWSHVDKSQECWLWTACQRPDGYGLLSCRLHGRQRTILAHRLAYLLSYGELPTSLFVRHLCSTKLCVRPDHLALGTAADNWRDCQQSGHARTFPRSYGARNPQAKLTEDQVREIIRRYVAGEKQADLAREFGISEQTISGLRRRGWAHVRAQMGFAGEVPDNNRGRNGNARLTEAQVREIRLHHAYGTMSFRAMAKYYGVSKPTIERVVYGKTWRQVRVSFEAPHGSDAVYRQLALFAAFGEGRQTLLQPSRRNARAKFTDAEVRTIRVRHAAGESFHALARSLDVAPATVARIVKREVYRDVD